MRAWDHLAGRERRVKHDHVGCSALPLNTPSPLSSSHLLNLLPQSDGFWETKTRNPNTHLFFSHPNSTPPLLISSSSSPTVLILASVCAELLSPSSLSFLLFLHLLIPAILSSSTRSLSLSRATPWYSKSSKSLILLSRNFDLWRWRHSHRSLGFVDLRLSKL